MIVPGLHLRVAVATLTALLGAVAGARADVHDKFYRAAERP